MDALSLLARAHEAGLVVVIAGDKLIVRGPRRAEPTVRLLAEHKPAVMTALAADCPPPRGAGLLGRLSPRRRGRAACLGRASDSLASSTRRAVTRMAVFRVRRADRWARGDDTR
jgi:hypothetical protein